MLNYNKIFILYLTNKLFRCVADRFNVDKGTAWRSVRRVVNALYAKVRTFIKWPSRQEAEQTMQTIENNYSFPGVIGAVDGTHIKISAPKYHSESYVNRKGFHSIQLQIINIYVLIHISFAATNCMHILYTSLNV